MIPGYFTRSFPLEDIAILKEGDGRTVEAYASVFRSPAEVHDQDGHYLEDIDPGAFTRTIQHKVNRFGVFYNHGLTIHGTPSDRGAVPIGTPLEVRTDNVGLKTVTRYNRTALADEVLEAIRTGAITAQSFSGRFLRSNPSRVPRRARGGELPKVTRLEIDLKEYGPTPFPTYSDALITGLRSLSGQMDTAEILIQLLERGELESVRALLAPGPRLTPEILISHGMTQETARELVLGLAGDDRGNLRSNEPNSSSGTGTPQDSPGSGTPPQDPPTGDPADASHSARLKIARIARLLRLKQTGAGHARCQEEERGS